MNTFSENNYTLFEKPLANYEKSNQLPKYTQSNKIIIFNAYLILIEKKICFTEEKV